MKVLIIGANGQLAHDLRRVLEENGARDVVTGLTHAQIEISDLTSVRETLSTHRPEVVINTSAFHKVEVCEDEPALSFAVNAVGPRNLALACRELNCIVLHLSTDYVFSGNQRKAYTETDRVDPVNIYGISKAAGEMALRYIWPKHYIVRSSGLYGVAGSSGKGGNFVELMLRLAKEGNEIRVVNDQILTPTSTRALAQQIVKLIDTSAYGTYHATCQGECSWYEFAAEVYRQVGVTPPLVPQTTAQSGTRARRPVYSVLENAALNQLGIDEMPDWRAALGAYLQEKHGRERSTAIAAQA